jgi:sugar phosphate isomerase/epimerase
MKYAITLASFRRLEPLDNTLSKLAGMGFDAVEMFGEPAEIDVSKVNDLVKSYGIPVCGVTGMWGSISKDGPRRRLLSEDASLVGAAEDYVRDSIKLCNSLGGSEFNICLFGDENPGVDRTHSMPDNAQKEKLASKASTALKELCQYAEDYGVTLVLEPLNRYSTPFCCSSRDAVRIAEMVNRDSLGILLDTFHMNIEEDSFDDALQHAQVHLKHMHFADNNRKMPGFAHIDFRSLIESIGKIGYNGVASFEPNIANPSYEAEVKSGLDFIRNMTEKMSA